MATRFYLPSTGTPTITPTVSGSFDGSASTFFRAVTSKTKISSAFRSDSQSVPDSQEECYAQFISHSLAVQTITANSDVKWSIMTSAQSGDGTYEVVIRVIASDGTTVRGTFYSDENVGTAWPSTGSEASRRVSVTTGTSSIVTQAGDFLVIEVGMYNVFAGATTGLMRFGDAGANDLDDANGDTGASDNPWFEFEHNFTFIAPSGLSYTSPVKYATGVAVANNDPTLASGTAYSYAITAGSLPSGLSLNATTGRISGTPTQGGTFSATITATNDGGSATFDVVYKSSGCSVNVFYLAQTGVRVG